MPTANVGDPKRRPSQVPSFKAEYGDGGDARRVFGLRPSFLYQLDVEGQIKSVLVKGRGKTRGKRLYSFASIRKLLKSLETEEVV